MADNDNKKSSKSPYLTTGERVRNFLGMAFIISLLAHVAFVAVLPKMGTQESEQKVEKVTVTHRVRIPTPPPPTPTPPPTPPPPKATPPPHQQKTAPQPKLKINVPHLSNAGPATEQKYVAPKQGSENGVPSGQGTGSPSPATAPPGPQCKVPYQDATATNAVQPDYPDSAREMGLGNVTVEVEVTVGPTGQLTAASIAHSGGNMAIDQAALRAARNSTYAPKIVNCKPVSGTYLFQADFSADS